MLVLLTEPDLIQAALLQCLLRDWGYDYRYAGTNAEIRAACRRNRFALILTDECYDERVTASPWPPNCPHVRLPKPYTPWQCRRAVERALCFVPCLLLVLLSAPAMQAQSPAARAAELLDYAGQQARYESFDHWREALEQVTLLVDTTAERELAGKLAQDWAEYYYQRVKDDSAKLYFAAARRHYAALSPTLTVKLLELDAILARMRDEDGRALELSLQAVEACAERNDSACLALALWDAGSAFFHQHQFAQATDYSERALRIMARQVDTLTFVNYLASHANTARLGDRSAAAAASFAEARRWLGSKRPPRLMATFNLDEGIFYMEEGDTARALRLFEEGLAYANVADDLISRALIVGNLGTLAFLRGDYPAAERRFREELRLAADVDDSWYTYGFQRLLAETFAAQGFHDSAYHYLNESYLNFEERVTDDYEQQLSELQVQFETSEKETQIALQRKELIGQRTLIYAIGGGLLLSLITGATLFILLGKLRRRNDTNQRLVAEKEVLIGEIHHRVKNNLQVISSLLQLQSRGLNNSDPRAYAALRDSQSRVQAMGLIHQKFYQGEETTRIHLPDYLEELGNTLLDAYRLDDRVEIDYHVEAVELDVDTAIPLGLIINELLTNALKYAFPDGRSGRIELSVRRSDDRLHVHVSDDGPGLDQHHDEPSGTGFGTRLITMLSQKLRAEVSHPDTRRGYATHLSLPLSEAAAVA